MKQIDFWAVGQGDCTVLTLQNGHFILIDVGPKASPVVQWFKRRAEQSAQVIDALVITHNHADHCGALESLLKVPGLSISKVYAFDKDIYTSTNEVKPFLNEMILRAKADELVVRVPNSGDVVWDSEQRCLEIVHPGFAGRVEAKDDINRRSLVLCLKNKNSNISEFVWGGDAYYNAALPHFKENTELLMGPHHGAPQGPRPKLPQQCYKYLFVSLASNNSHGHPSRSYIRKHQKRGVNVACTCMTKSCGLLNRHLKKPSLYGHIEPSGRENYFCRGGMQYFLDSQTDSWIIDPEEKDYVDLKKELHKPLCVERKINVE